MICGFLWTGKKTINQETHTSSRNSLIYGVLEVLKKQDTNPDLSLYDKSHANLLQVCNKTATISYFSQSKVSSLKLTLAKNVKCM